jgi:hypothetical protein
LGFKGLKFKLEHGGGGGGGKKGLRQTTKQTK